MFGISGSKQSTTRPRDASRLEDLVLQDLDGGEVRLGDRWSRNPALLVFLRHYG